MTTDIQKGDGLVLFNGQHVIAEGGVSDLGSEEFPRLCVQVTSEDGRFTMPVQVSAVVEIWRGGVKVLQQLSLFGET